MFACLALQVLSKLNAKNIRAKTEITYYSMIKLQHESTKFLLSSIDVSYQTGSTQQIVRGVNESKLTLAETYWTVYPPEGTDVEQGQHILCNSNIRLLHGPTMKWLHSHAITAQLGEGYEVSAFDGNDTGDVWTLECDQEQWLGDTPVRLHHVDTDNYLSANATGMYIKELMGEHEIFCGEKREGSEWTVRHGIFVGE